MNPAESAALAGLPPLAVALYVALRPRVRPGGVVVGLSRAALRQALTVAATRTTRRQAPTIEAIRHAERQLFGAGLLVRESTPPRLLLPLSRQPHLISVQDHPVMPLKPQTCEMQTPCVSRTDSGSYAGQPELPGFPPDPPSLFPPYNPPYSLPPSTPHPSARGAKTDRVRIRGDWQPMPETLLALRQKGIDDATSTPEVGHFRLYWQAQRGADSRKTEAGWQLAFVKWTLKLKPGTGDRRHAETARDRDLGAAGRQAEAIARHFASRRGPGDA